MSLADRVKETHEYRSNSLVRPGDLSDRLGEPSVNIRAACLALVEQGLMQRDGLHFRRAGKHWIHSAPLNDKKRIEAAKEAHAGRVLV